ncbi:non-ribosomal peptide synthetase [Roseibium sp. RKSG952]|uniref:non-ribosomal peptide synthetase n=1 Tax=Roseibium sp. RKSG952 TaxID=2529384 RepID=UPI0018AD21BE|nr:non-ribosomal peptide synthetase [Roseibium sp. RKSG952]
MDKSSWIFILSAPRSGSTLLVRLLGNHREISAPVELHLAGFRDLGERKAYYKDHPSLLQGFDHAVATLAGTGTKNLPPPAFNHGTTISECYQYLSEQAGTRYIIDKTAGYSLSPERLESIPSLVDSPRFLVLRRHPAAVVESLTRTGLTSVYAAIREKLQDDTPEAIAEYVWSRSNLNIDRFLERLSAPKVHTVYYEDLVLNTQRCVRNLCKWLALEEPEAPLDPYAQSHELDILSESEEPPFDPGFLTHTTIEPALAYRWDEATVRDFSPDLVARMQGYGYTSRKQDITFLPDLANQAASSTGPNLSSLPNAECLSPLEATKLSFLKGETPPKVDRGHIELVPVTRDLALPCHDTAILFQAAWLLFGFRMLGLSSPVLVRFDGNSSALAPTEISGTDRFDTLLSRLTNKPDEPAFQLLDLKKKLYAKQNTIQLGFILDEAGTPDFIDNVLNGQGRYLVQECDTLLIVSRQAQSWDFAIAQFGTRLDTLEPLAFYFERLAMKAWADPTRTCETFEVMGGEEHETVVTHWNRTEADYPADRTLTELFETQVGRTPDSIALEYCEEAISYSELNARANRLAHAIRRQFEASTGAPFGADTLVALCLDRSPEMIVSIIGALKAGGAYLPIDPDCPQERVRFMLEDCQAQLLLTQQRHVAQLEGIPAAKAGSLKILAVDDDGMCVSCPSDTPEPVSGPQNLAYVIYTSGTTGQPKGVMVSQAQLQNRLAWMQSDVPLGANDVLLQKTPYTFDVSVWELLWWAFHGARVAILPPNAHRDMRLLADAIENHGVSILHFVPSLFEAYLDGLESGEMTGSLRSLRAVFTSGEALQPQHNRRFHRSVKAQGRSIALHNLYGPTETTIDVTAYHTTGNEAVLPIGSPVWNTQAYVADGQLNPVPVGVTGLLLIGGDQVSRGYLGRPGLTADRYTANPFTSSGSRLYRTGDLARWQADGTLEFLGRADFQVKIRGNRIELGEIEQVLTSQDPVAQAAVLAKRRRGNGRDLFLAAYYVRSKTIQKATDLENRLRTALLSKLPGYMVPDVFVELDALPLTASGKLDRRALPEPDTPLGRDTGTEPRSDLERQLHEIWADVLGLERIKADASFFRIGGDSIKAIRLVTRINQHLGHQLTVAAIFKYPTIEALAHMLARLSQSQLSIPKAIGVSKYPLSFAQERLWFIEQYEGGASAYHSPRLFKLAASVNRPALKESLAAIVARHEVLRSHFVQDRDGIWYQSVSTRAFGVAEHRIAETAWPNALQNALHKTFDLENEPPIRADIFTAGDQAFLLIVVHHVAFDGWSAQILSRELAAHYRHLVEDAPLDLPELTIQYKDFAVWQRGYMSGDRLKRQLGYWSERLAGHEVLNFPTDHPRPALFDYQGDVVTFTLGADLSNRLRSLASARNVSLNTLLWCVYAILLSRYSRQNDLVLGWGTANRHYPQVDDLIGFFVNALPLRVQVDPHQPFFDFLETVRKRLSEAQQFQDIPFELLVSTLEVERDQSRHPVFQHSFSLQSFPGEQIDGLEPVSLTETFKRALFDLSVFMDASGEKIQGRIEFATSLFTRTRMTRYAVHLKNMLSEVAASPERAISNFRFLPREEYDQIVCTWNQTQKDCPKDQTLAALFEKQAECTPDAIAIVFEEEALTYRDLNARANRLAHAIRQRFDTASGETLQADTLIALYLDRGPWMIVSILGVLKAGGAYVPIDPDYPQERVRFMLADSKAPLLVTRKNHLRELKGWNTPIVEALHVIVVSDTHTLPDCSPYNPSPVGRSANLAYVIYTSGTTGNPKGVMVEQHSLLNLISNQTAILDLNRTSRALQFASYSFDASALEIFSALLHGARLYVYAHGVGSNGGQILDYIENNAISLATLPPSLLKALPYRDLPDLKTLIVAGEACDLPVMKLWSREQTLINGYGPTENTVGVAMHPYRPGDGNTNIGRPMANVTCYVLDPSLEPVPIGAIGELFVGGVGLARGYLNRAALTSDRFIANPFATESDAEQGHTRLYRTGDLVRWLDNGDMQYVGRNDFQVKIRGHRIELSEIEQKLVTLGDVEQAAVQARNRPGPEQAQDLVAYFVPSDTAREKLAQSHGEAVVKDWKKLYQSLYGGTAPADSTFDTGGWISSFTRRAIPEADMREWVAATVARIADLTPRHILEIGSGTGLLLYRLLDKCQHYTATDFSESAISQITETVTLLGKAGKVTGLVGEATSIGTRSRITPVDTVIVNSVAQYFPGMAYFEQMLDAAISCLEGHGRIFLGDLRDLRLVESFYLAVQAYRSPDTSLQETQKQARWLARRDKEFLLDPGYFLKLRTRHPAVSHIKILPKRGYARHEMNRFRYDVILWIDKAPNAVPPSPAFRRFAYSEIGDLKDWLSAQQMEDGLIVDGYPNKRVRAVCQAMQQDEPAARGTPVSKILAAADIDSDSILGIEALHTLAQEKGYRLDIFLDPGSRHPDQYALLFRPLRKNAAQDVFSDQLFEAPSSPDQRFGNIPFTAQRAELGETLRTALASRLPGYMVPSVFVEVDALPLTVNGKLDRAALPNPDAVLNEACYIAPGNQLEARLSSIWSEILGLERIGVETNFFRIGGNSIEAIRLSARLSKSGFPCRIIDIFEHPTIRQLSRFIETKTPAIGFQDKKTAFTDGLRQLAPIQEWFFEQVGKGYIQDPQLWAQTVLVRVPPLDPERLKSCLKALVAAHPNLTVRFRRGAPDDQPTGAGHWHAGHDGSSQHPELEITDVSSLHTDDLHTRLTEWQNRLDLENGPLWRIGYLHGYPDGSARIFICMHQLVTDAVSRSILIDDLRRLYDGDPLPQGQSSYADWVKTVRHHATHHPDERHYWRQLLTDLPSGPALVSTANEAPVYGQSETTLGLQETRQVLQDCHLAYDTQVNELLLTALACGLHECGAVTRQAVTLKGHGRKQIDSGLDVQRTVGWFTTMFPVVVNLKADLSQTIQHVKRLLSDTPYHGIGFESFCTDENSNIRYSDLPSITLSFASTSDEHMGQAWHISDELTSVSMAPCSQEGEFVHVKASVVDQKLRIQVFCSHGPQIANRIAQAVKGHLVKIIQHCLARITCLPTRFSFRDFPDFKAFEAIDRHSPERAIFMFPPRHGGPESYYSNIVPRLKSEDLILFHNFINFLADSDLSYHVKNVTIETLARAYMEPLKAYQAHGPYHLFGWSFGGTLALEVARQLSAQGEPVEDLILVDPYFNLQRAYDYLFSKLPGSPPRASALVHNKDLIIQPWQTDARIVLFKTTRVAKTPSGPDARSDALSLVRKFDIEDYYVHQTRDNHLSDVVRCKNTTIIPLTSPHADWVNSKFDIERIAGVLESAMKD